VAEDVWVKFMIRYHHQEITLRETLVRILDRRGGNGSHRARWAEEFWALRGISLMVNPGDVIGLIGRNGAGKTVTLKTIAGIIGADRGSLTVRGKVACLLSFGIGFNPTLSGRENIYLNGSILGLSRKAIDERLPDVVAFSELGEFIDAPVRTYSVGMRGRLGFSIAIHIDPDILVLDEVLGVGDAAFAAKAGTILDRFRSERKAVIVATHNMDLVRRSCNRAIWIDSGKIVQEGEPVDVTNAYMAASGASKGSK
jgi:ABC-type polysaccharide/polyol phosphate transport system ATPase subunit